MAATKTLNYSWKERLSNLLATSRRTAFVGVGQELRGDDAAGILAVRRLEKAFEIRRTAGEGDSNISARIPTPFLFEAGPFPESSAGALRRFQPDRVVFLDAAELGETPGSIGWIEPDQIVGIPAGTHTFPLSGFGRYLESELGCRVAVLGIQPKQLEFDSPASEEILSAVDDITRFILAASAGQPEK